MRTFKVEPLDTQAMEICRFRIDNLIKAYPIAWLR